MSKNNNVLLIVLDGVGINRPYKGNAFYLAKKPCFDKLWQENPHTLLGASEKYVGLPKKQLGSSEVGHSTIGAGRIIESDLLRINNAISDKSIYKNRVLKDALMKLNKIKKNALHIIGLLSDGGVHSHISHLFAILDAVKAGKLDKSVQVYLHIISDGRDTYNKSLPKYLGMLTKKLNTLNIGQIASISGRYYAMDRDNRWDRLKKVYDLLVSGIGDVSSDSPKMFVKKSYAKEVTDEFLEPTLFRRDALIKDNDCLLFFNFRSDRAREFTRLFVDDSFDIFKRKALKIDFISLTEYDAKFNGKNIKVMFPELRSKPGIGQLVALADMRQLRVAETEKYAHVTYFFNQGQERPNKKEDRILVPSPKVATYDLKPEMSAGEITNKLLPWLNKDYRFILVNFANGDMVGHTGNLKATIKGIEFVDKCLKRIIDKVDLQKTVVIITADHGNCDEMIYPDGRISTAHSLSKVPFIVVSKNYCNIKNIKDASIANIGSAVLDFLGIKKPKYMADALIG